MRKAAQPKPGWTYCFVHPQAPGRVKVGFSGRDPNVDVAPNREARASKLNAGLQVFGFGPVENGFFPQYHDLGSAIDLRLKSKLKQFQVEADDRGRLTEVYSTDPAVVLRLYEEARDEVMRAGVF